MQIPKFLCCDLLNKYITLLKISSSRLMKNHLRCFEVFLLLFACILIILTKICMVRIVLEATKGYGFLFLFEKLMSTKASHKMQLFSFVASATTSHSFVIKATPVNDGICQIPPLNIIHVCSFHPHTCSLFLSFSLFHNVSISLMHTHIKHSLSHLRIYTHTQTT